MQTHDIAKHFCPPYLSVCLSFCLSKAYIMTKQKKLVFAFLYHMKGRSS